MESTKTISSEDLKKKCCLRAAELEFDGDKKRAQQMRFFRKSIESTTSLEMLEIIARNSKEIIQLHNEENPSQGVDADAFDLFLK